MKSVTKVCRTCKKEKKESEFHFRTDTKKYRNDCIECYTEFHRKLYLKQAEERRAWAREYSKTYYPLVREKKKKYVLDHVLEIKKRMFEYQKDYYSKNKKKINQKNKRWSDEFPEKRAVITARRRARLANAEGFFTEEEWADLCRKYEYKCLCCCNKRKLTVDHVIPLIVGGTNYISNIQPLCKPCNSKKGTKYIDYR